MATHKSKDHATPPRLSTDWTRFARRLAQQLPALEAGHYLILSVPGAHRFVQFAPGGASGLRAETVSNEYLERGERLSRADMQALRALGWSRPTQRAIGSGTDGDATDGSPNWFVDVDAPVDFAAVAMLTVRTFTEVYGVPHPSRLQYHAFASAGPAILLPGLGLVAEPMHTRPVADASRNLLDDVEDACLVVADGAVERDDEEGVLDVMVQGIPFRVVVSEEDEVARLLCRLMPVDDLGGELFEQVNRLNAHVMPFGYVYIRDGEVRWATEVVLDSFSVEVFAATLLRAAAVVSVPASG